MIAEKRSAWMKYVNEKKKSPGSHNHHGKNQSQVPGEKKQRATGGEKIMNEKMKGHPCEKNDEKSGGSPMGCVGCVRVGGGAGYVEAMKAPSGQGRAQPIEEPPCGSGLELEQAKFAYRLALNQARRAVVRDKRRHWQEAAQKLEQLFKQGNLHQACKKVKIRAEPCKRQ